VTRFRSQAEVEPSPLPHKVLISAWVIPILVLGEFSVLAAIPVAIAVVGVLRHVRVGALRRWALALGAVYAAPMIIWAIRPDRAPSLSKDMSPIFVTWPRVALSTPRAPPAMSPSDHG
jgi:hypothetical protein